MDVRADFGRGWLILAVFLCVFAVSRASAGYNVLFMSPFASISHRLVMDPVAESLGKRGNNVTFLTSIKELRPIKGVTSHHMVNAEIEMNEKGFNFFLGTLNDPAFLNILMNMVEAVCKASFEDSSFQKLLAMPRGTSGYDVMVIDGTFNECTLALAYHMDIPTVYFATAPAFLPILWNMNIPFPLSYLKNTVSNIRGEMSFWQRFTNAVEVLLPIYLRHSVFHPKLEAVTRKYVPDSPSLAELENRVSFVIANVHVAVYPSAPTMPYYVSVGCLNCMEPKKLPKDLEAYLATAEHGAIFFSMGSYTKGDSMPKAMKEKVIAAFSKIPQKVLWKYEGKIDNLPSNVLLQKWLPQQDLLAHPKIILFITHGGGLSVQEAAYHGCPILGFPLAVDQLGNMNNAINRGFGESLEWRDFTTDDLVQHITKMVNGPDYRKNAKHASVLLKDQPQDPRDLSAYYIEYVARHKGAPHLKSGAENLNLFQYFLLDVIGAVVLVLVVALLAVVFLIKLVFKFLCSGKKAAKDKKKLR